MNFEDAMKELEEIIKKLEGGDAKFDEATALYERGATLCEFLSNKFKDSKGKITKVTELLGSILEEDFN